MITANGASVNSFVIYGILSRVNKTGEGSENYALMLLRLKTPLHGQSCLIMM